MMWYTSLAVLAVVCGLAEPRGPVLSPLDVPGFCTEPGKPVILRWEAASPPDAEAAPLPYRLLDQTGRVAGEGTLQRTGPKSYELSMQPGQGFLEVEFPFSSQRFGVIVLPAWTGERDPFFAIDGALSWLVPEMTARQVLVETAGRCGISMIRERMNWSAIAPDRTRRDWEGASRYDSLRRFYRERGMSILEMAHDSPPWLGHVGKYPADLPGAERSWAEIGRRWQSGWGAVEIWNEPDIFFGGDLPADQYAALVKALVFGLSKAGIRTPVVGGVIALPNLEFLETCGQSGLLDHVDAFSFHTYENTMKLDGLVRVYREWLKNNGHGSMPLWLTESGRPWTRGPDRPPIDEDRRSALDITMKGVEARACGVARYFPFVLPFFEENSSNFGMTDRQRTPLRSLAAYAQLIRVLAHQDFLGDLQHDDSKLLRARLFGRGPQRIAVLYTGLAGQATAVRPGLSMRRAEGIDGRPLPIAGDGSILVPDGLCYIWLDPAVKVVPRSTPASAIRVPPPAGPGKWREPPPSSIVIRFRLDPARYEPSARAYRLTTPSPGLAPLGFEVWNLGDSGRSLSLGLKLQSNEEIHVEANRPIDVPAGSSKTVEWTIDMGSLMAAEGTLKALVTARDQGGLLDHLAVVLHGEADLERTLSHRLNPIPLPMRDRTRWRPSVGPTGTMTMDSTGEAAWRLQVRHGEGKDGWAYPVFQIPDEIRLDRSSGMVLRARCFGRAKVRVFLWEGDGNVGYITAEPILPADGQWHVARIAFRDLVPSTANAVDPDGHLNLDHVRRLSVGINLEAAENTLEVSDLYLVGERTPLGKAGTPARLHGQGGRPVKPN